MKKNIEEKIGIFSFFAGAGFLDLGFEKTSGFETVFVNEYHAPFMEIYKGSRENLGIKKPILGHHVQDISGFLEDSRLRVLSKDLDKTKQSFDVTGFIGGPPCPDFSVGGKNKGKEGENGKLSGTYIELICKTKPDFFLFENVKGLWRTKKHRAFYESLKSKLQKNGYSLTERLINAIEYGAPQDRDRIILIGFHKDFLKRKDYAHNQTQFLWNFDWDIARKYDAKTIFNLEWPQIEPFLSNGLRPAPYGLLKELSVNHWFKKNDVENHPNSSKYFQPRAGLVKFQTISEGDDKKKSYKRLHRWRYSPTAAYGNNEVHLHPFLPRRISVAEALSLQSLPKEFVIPDHITLSNSFKAIGNGVPFLAAKGLALTILNFLGTIDPTYKPYLDGEIDSSESGSLYKSIAEATQLSVLEPEEQGANKN
ncbi:DNA cytosine methyltransferase [Algoriphagus yeomjeoni]|uniref:DNA cytosine methyltransferase n=1 Tax=Algoriphagus yeomjeoni TaxID=291403 RepID=UPI003CE52EEB